MSDINFVYPGGNAPLIPTFPTGAGRYIFPVSEHAQTTNASLGLNLVRAVPWIVYSAFRIDRMGGEVTAIGDVGSLFRFGIWQDNGAAFPFKLFLDAGTIAGDNASVQDCPTLSSPLTIPPGIYWTGGGIQNATTTQPTMRTVNNWTPPLVVQGTVSLPSTAATNIGFSATMAGALTDWPQGGINPVGAAVRPHMKVVP